MTAAHLSAPIEYARFEAPSGRSLGGRAGLSADRALWRRFDHGVGQEVTKRTEGGAFTATFAASGVEIDGR